MMATTMDAEEAEWQASKGYSLVYRNHPDYKGLPLEWTLVTSGHVYGKHFEYAVPSTVGKFTIGDPGSGESVSEAFQRQVLEKVIQGVHAYAGKTKLKSRPDLFPADALALAGEVLAFGSEKHPSEPWRTMDTAAHLAAALRHYCEHQAGRTIDSESGKKHLVHFLVRAAMAVAVDASG